MHEILADVRGVLREAEADERRLEPYGRLAWEIEGRAHRLIVCDEDRVRAHEALCVVGFFGLQRSNVDPTPLEEANMEVVKEFEKYPGILSYSSMELPGRQWANVVLHERPGDAEAWRSSRVHAEAVHRLAPVHYQCVRIHNAMLSSPLFASPEIGVKRTKYFDYSGDGEWRAERTFRVT